MNDWILPQKYWSWWGAVAKRKETLRSKNWPKNIECGTSNLIWLFHWTCFHASLGIAFPNSLVHQTKRRLADCNKECHIQSCMVKLGGQYISSNFANKFPATHASHVLSLHCWMPSAMKHSICGSILVSNFFLEEPRRKQAPLSHLRINSTPQQANPLLS